MQPQGQAQIIVNLVDYGLDLQAAGDSPRWHHEGSSEPTGAPDKGVGLLHLETGAPRPRGAALAALGWPSGESDGGFGGYQAIQRAGPLCGRHRDAQGRRRPGLLKGRFRL